MDIILISDLYHLTPIHAALISRQPKERMENAISRREFLQLSSILVKLAPWLPMILQLFHPLIIIIEAIPFSIVYVHISLVYSYIQIFPNRISAFRLALLAFDAIHHRTASYI